MEKFAYDNDNSTETDNSTTYGEEEDETNDTVRDRHYKLSLGRESQIRHHERIRHNKTFQRKTD